MVDTRLYLNVVQMPASYPAAIKRGKEDEDEDMDGDRQHLQTSRP
jgi:hypothetical protein